MKSINDMKIGFRLNLVLSTTIIVLLSAFGVFTFNSQMNSYLDEADLAMREEVKDLALFVTQQLKKSENSTLESKDIDYLKGIFLNKRYYKDGYPYIVAKDGKAIIHPTKENGDFSGYEFFRDMISSSEPIGRSNYIWEGETKVQYFKYINEIDAYVSVTFYDKNLKSKVNKSINSLIIMILILIGVFVLISWSLSRSITQGLKKAVDFAESISHGDLTQVLQLERKDEIGQLALALQNMKQKLEEIIAEIVEGANQITQASQELSTSSTEQAASTEEVSANMEEMIANIEQNSENANQTEKIANKAAIEINIGYESVTQTVKSMQEIAEKITIIEEIAEKTDLLAINAAIEAARAGEHGKGFAVVAMEVRKLAERSQLAAAEINKVSKSSVRIAEETGRKMGEIVPEIKKTSALVQEISASSNEQNTGAEQVNGALQLLNQTNQSTAANAEELASQAEVLKESIAFFTVDNRNKKKAKANNKHQYKSNGNGHYNANKEFSGIVMEGEFEKY